MSNLIITVGHKNADVTGDTNCAIQSAVDKAAAAGGGTVKIAPGRYIMHNTLDLKTNVTVQGSGADTVLWKPPSVSSFLSVDLGYGHYDFTVSEPEKFTVGMGVRLSDDASAGFYNTVATIIDKYDNTLVIDTMLNHDYSLRRHARAVSVYPIVRGYRVENACLRDLTIDGNKAQNEYIDGCRGGCVFLIQCRDIKVIGLSALSYNGDAIGYQQCLNTLVEDCLCEDNAGTGLHLGSGSVGSAIRNVTSRSNGGDGLFFCFRATRTLVENCRFLNNKLHGVTIGLRDNDIELRNNLIEGNAQNGLIFRQDSLGLTGNRTEITGNTFKNNCAEEGDAEIFISCPTVDVWIHDNAGIDRGDIKAADDSYFGGVTFGPPPPGYKFSTEAQCEREKLHLGPVVDMGM